MADSTNVRIAKETARKMGKEAAVIIAFSASDMGRNALIVGAGITPVSDMLASALAPMVNAALQGEPLAPPSIAPFEATE